MSKGETCAAYVGAGPPKGTGLHRYIILGLCNTIICMYYCTEVERILPLRTVA